MTPDAWPVVWANDIAARYHAAHEDRIAAACWAAEYDPGTPEAWADGCECERPRSKDGDPFENVAWGCPMHDPTEAR